MDKLFSLDHNKLTGVNTEDQEKSLPPMRKNTFVATKRLISGLGYHKL